MRRCWRRMFEDYPLFATQTGVGDVYQKIWDLVIHTAGSTRGVSSVRGTVSLHTLGKGLDWDWGYRPPEEGFKEHVWK